jgi:catechol 2,3-dioxygenase-like lactoylglutathione lyase family enzyme
MVPSVPDVAARGEDLRGGMVNCVVISVEDLNTSLEFYSDTLGFKKLADVELGDEGIERLWGLEKGTRARIIVVGRAGARVGLVRLMQFTPRSRRFVHQDAELWDIGVFYLHTLVDDIDRRYDELRARGYEFFGSQTVWQVPEQNRTIKEALFRGPDGLIIDILQYEIFTSRPAEKQPKYSEIATSARVVKEIEKLLAFYRDMLGYRVIKDQVPGNKQLDTLLRLPPDSRIRVVHLARGNDPMGKIELVEFLNVKGRELVARPTDIGPFMLSFGVEDVDRLFELFRQENVSVICPPVEIEIPPNGRTKVMTVNDPGGLMLEFTQS